jgi:hypothetical protein
MDGYRSIWRAAQICSTRLDSRMLFIDDVGIWLVSCFV